MYKNSKVPVKCIKCGNDFEIHRATYNRKLKENKDTPQFICKNCYSIIKSEESKKYWDNLPEDERYRRVTKLVSERNKFFNNMPSDIRIEINNKISKKRKAYWDNMDIEDRIQFGLNHKKWWDNLTSEEREIQFAPMREGYWLWYNSLTDEEKKEISRMKSKYSSDYWNNMTVEEKTRWIKKRRDGFNKYFNSLNSSPNKNESDFINYLNLNNLDYKFQWYNEIDHPSFYQLFPSNPVTGASIVLPFHAWDFIIYLRDKIVIVDIDGSIHNPYHQDFKVVANTGKVVNINDIMKFNDSQRLYQTDGYDAYIVQCYDDKLTDDTPVIKLQTGEKMTVKQLMDLLYFMNSPLNIKIKH